MSGKQNGLGAEFLVAGYRLSGDVSAIDTIHCGLALLPGTDITQSAMARIPGQKDGSMSFTTYMDPANAHPVLSALPTSDQLMTAMMPPMAIGSPSACCNAKQVNYDPTRANDGGLLNKTDGQGNGFGTEWGVLLTPGLRTDTTATNGTGLDQGAGFSTPSVPLSGTPVTNTSPLPATVVVSGGTGTNVAINGVNQGTFDGTYTIVSGATITLTYSVAPTWTWTLQSAFGAQAYLQVTAFSGTSVTAAVQDSADGTSYSAVTGLTFTAATAAPYTQRLATAGNATIRRYLRVSTTGTFASATFAVVVNRNLAATSF